jgi:hypothetical protein
VLIVNFLMVVIKKSLKADKSFSNIVRFVEFIYSTISTLLNFYKAPKTNGNWKVTTITIRLFDDYLTA